MFGTIRRHQTWLWAVIITLTVISFVIFFNPNMRYSGREGGGRVNLGSIDGKAVSLDDYRAMQAEVILNYFLSHGEWPDKDPSAKQLGFNLERDTYYRLFLVGRFESLGIQVSRKAVGEYAAEILRSMRPEEFEQKILRSHGLQITDFERFVRHALGIQQLIATAGLSGALVSPQEAETFYRRENEEVATEAVFFSVSNHLSRVTATPEAVQQFFTNQMARYRVPDRVQVSYVKFNVADYFAEADQQIAKLTNFNDQVEAVYLQRGTNFYREAKSPAEAKAKIKDEIHLSFALRAARAKAAAFTDELLNLSPVRPDNLSTFAAQKGLTVEVTAPFNAQDGPVELEVPPVFARTAFKLTEADPITGPIVATNGVYVIALKKKFPSEIPALETIRQKVTGDYHYVEAMQLARNAGESFHKTLAGSLAQGKTFAALCAEAKVEPVKIPRFSLATRALPEVEDRVSLGQLQEAALGTATGKTSGFLPTMDGGLVLHMLARFPVAEEKLKKELPTFLVKLRQTRQSEAFNVWFSREAQVGLRDTPIARAQATGEQ
jgi:hypothetical protein